MTAGTYHTELDGSVISGVTYPVKINEKVLESFTKVDSEDALYGNADHAYYVLDQEPSYYKEATVENGNVSFGKSVNKKEVTEYTSDANVSMTLLEGNHNMHGDYEMRFSDLPDDCILRDTNTVVYGAVLHTSLNGTSKDYGLRYQENIFHHKKNNFEIAWATGSGDGFRTTVKGAELSYEPYADMMGRSLTGLTVYTDQGIIEITLQNEKYVPIKQNYDITVTAPEVNATETTYAGTEPFANAQITVTDADDQEVEGITVDTVNKKISWTEDLAAGTYKLVFTDPSGKYASISVPFTIQSSTVYVLMNIPYGEFYANELENNEVEVDAVSSATANTTYKASDKLYSAGSYHYDLTQINGVTYPVKAKAEDLKDFTAVESSDDLYQNQDHVYYILSEKPEYYKTLTSENGELSFSKVVTDQEATEYKIDTTLNTNVKHGDYDLTMSGLGVLNSNDTTVYGTILHTTNKAGETVDYGMRVVENIFKKKGPFELGWSSGLMKVGNKGCTLSYEHYESMIGNTITGFTAYTDHGTIEVTFENGLYVPEKFEVADFKIADASVEDSAQITGLDLPDDYAAEYVVTNADGEEMSGFEVKGDTITWPDDTEAGTYTLTVSDSNNKYFSFSTKFALIGNETQTGEAEVSVVNSKGTEFDNYTAKVSVVYDPVSGKIVSVADNATDYGDNDDFWQQALDAMVSWLKGKTVSDLKGKDVTEIDDVSGATCTAKGIKNAVLTALGAEPDTQSAELAAIMVSAAPAEVKFYKNEEVVKTVEVDADELDALGSLEILDVALDPKYEEDWNEFTVVVVDEEGNELENEANVVDDTFTVILADGREIVISFNFDTEEKKEEVPAADKEEEVSDSEVSDPEDTENEVKEEEKADDPSSDEENEDADAADDQDTEEKEDTEEAEDKSDESEDVTEEDKSEENEDSTEDAASDDKEDALEVPEVGESTEGTTVEETETLSKDGE